MEKLYTVSKKTRLRADVIMKGFSAFLDMISSPGGSDSKESACNAGNLGLIPVGKIPWRGQ